MDDEADDEGDNDAGEVEQEVMEGEVGLEIE